MSDTLSTAMDYHSFHNISHDLKETAKSYITTYTTLTTLILPLSILK